MDLFKEEHFKKKEHCIILDKFIVTLKDISSYTFNEKYKKNKFIRFIKDYNIISNNNVKTIQEVYNFLGVTCKLDYCRIFQNIKIFNGVNKDNKSIRFITLQPHNNFIYANCDEKLIEYISKQDMLMTTCAYYGHTINIFKNNKYNWEGFNNTFILLTLNHNLEYSKYAEVNIHYPNKVIHYRVPIQSRDYVKWFYQC